MIRRERQENEPRGSPLDQRQHHAGSTGARYGRRIRPLPSNRLLHFAPADRMVLSQPVDAQWRTARPSPSLLVTRPAVTIAATPCRERITEAHQAPWDDLRNFAENWTHSVGSSRVWTCCARVD